MCAVKLAEEAVARSPGCATYWNTLGVAYYRAEDWDFAIRALERSVELGSGGTGFDYFFLAMAYWRRGDKGRAREWFDRAEAWVERHDPGSPELLRLRAEAAAMSGSPTRWSPLPKSPGGTSRRPPQVGGRGSGTG